MKACHDQVLAMKDILQKYAASTGLHINFHKSSLIPINLSTQQAAFFAGLLGCNIATMPFTYLGLPLGTTKPTVQDLMPLVDRIERRVSATFLMMNYSGRVTVVNSLLTSIANFTMCSIHINPKILEHVEKIRRHCLWNKKTEDGEKSNSLAAWDMVCKPKKKGGLGILNLKIKNEGLLLKYLHKFYNKEDTPWVHLLWNTYYSGKVPHTMAPCGSFWWRAVFNLSHTFRGITVSHVNDGYSTLFWKDKWLSNINSEEFPRAFSYTKNEDISVRDFLTSNQLSLNFSLPLSPQALDEIRVLQGLAAHIDFSNDTHDTWTYEWGLQTIHPVLTINSSLETAQPILLFMALEVQMYPQTQILLVASASRQTEHQEHVAQKKLQNYLLL
jgi:hypothetical protein